MDKKLKANNKNQIALIPVIILLAMTILAGLRPNFFSRLLGRLLAWLVENFSYFYLLAMFAFLAFLLVLALSKYGEIRLGKDSENSEISRLEWIAKLFSTGMGAGLILWASTEASRHFVRPDLGLEAGSLEAADFALVSSFIHWGPFLWANFGLVGLVMAYMHHVKGEPLLISSAIRPLFRNFKYRDQALALADMVAIFTSVSGVATSLGMGISYINSMLAYSFDLPINKLVYITITLAFALIVVLILLLGWDRLISLVAGFNVLATVALMLFLAVLGPSSKIMANFVNSCGQVSHKIIPYALRLSAWSDKAWLYDWTVFYWAWWISWSAFTGLYIAKISKGRTIREYVAGVILVPSLTSFFWISVFGTIAMDQGLDFASQLEGLGGAAVLAIVDQVSYGHIIGFILNFLAFSFLLVSVNSASQSLDLMSGSGREAGRRKNQATYACIIVAFALALYMSGGIGALQASSILAAFPFTFIMLAMILSLIKVLKEDEWKK